MNVSVHSTAYVWNPSAYDARRSDHQPYVFERPVSQVKGPQLSCPRTTSRPLGVR